MMEDPLLSMSYTDRVASISDALSSNSLLTTGQEFITETLSSYNFSDEKIQETIVTLTGNVITQTLSKVLDIALQYPLSVAQKEMADVQTKNESLKYYDILSGIRLKDLQQKATYESAAYDNARRKVLYRSDCNNVKIQNAKISTDFLQAVATRVDPSTEQYTLVTTSIDAVKTDELTDTFSTEIGEPPTNTVIPDTL